MLDRRSSKHGVGMPVDWEIRDSILIITVIGHGDHEPIGAIAEAINDPEFRPGISLLFDMRLSTDSPTGNKSRERVALLTPLREKGISSRCAIVVGPLAHQYGLARMAGAYADLKGWQLQIFTDKDEALGWLTVASDLEPEAK